tara:strand:+ start:154 stop:1650 length:1497 start_codon:yes stop_codon:yes gene_type:complete
MRITFFLIFVSIIFLFGCEKDVDDNTIPILRSEINNSNIDLEGNLEISDFVWKGLNEFYYWQEEVEELSDNKLKDESAYAKYISENSQPKEFFESLKHLDDRFSWIEDNYRVLENTLQGIFSSNGVEFGLLYACKNCNELIGFVKYILKGSNAEEKNIKRGDLFTGVNGAVLTASNYRSLLFGNNMNYTLNMAAARNGSIFNTGVDVELTKEENFEINPIQISEIINLDKIGQNENKKIGYLMYNQFVSNKSHELNQVFDNFKNEGVSELVIDLRYNGGGSIKNCVELASMITGQFTNEIFAEEQWNSKLLPYLRNNFGKETLINRFRAVLEDGEEINSLNLNRVFIITSSESASASELLINGLSSYINVIQIGEKTVGKNVGSITVYDYIDNEQTKNPDHTYAMQPIVLKIANNDGFADYADGLYPDYFIEEDLQDMGVLGTKDEPILSKVLDVINGTSKSPISKNKISKGPLVKDPLTIKRQVMFVEKNEIFLNQN